MTKNFVFGGDETPLIPPLVTNVKLFFLEGFP